MPRRPRLDRPGSLHHVTNRGHGHRTLFGSEGDVRHFLALLARAVRRGGLEVHSYAVLSTHFHLLAGSPEGEMASALQWSQDLFARYYNRTRERDGHVFKGRYFSRPIQDAVDLAMVVNYVDRQAVSAGMVQHPAEYSNGSARYYVTGEAPPWLCTTVLHELACRVGRTTTFEPSAYESIWRAFAAPDSLELVARASAEGRIQLAPIAQLARSGPEYVQEWLYRQAVREERSCAAVLVLSPSQVDRLAFEASGADLTARLPGHGSIADLSVAMRAGLLHTLAGVKMSDVALRLQVPTTKAYRLVDRHRAALSDPSYAMLVASLILRCLRATYGHLAHIRLPWEAGDARASVVTKVE